MLPYADDTESYSPPTWIFLLIGANVIAFIVSISGGIEHYIEVIFAYGMIPARFFAGADTQLDYNDVISSQLEGVKVNLSVMAPPYLTLFTSMFLHGGIFHLIGNMWFLWLFGDNVEDRLGKLIFPIFYIVCGLIAGLAHIMVEHNSQMPAIGASGAIAGVMGAYIYMFPRSTIRTWVSMYFWYTTIYVPAPIYLGLWLILQLFGGFAENGSNVAFMAHIGGFVGGFVLAVIFDKIKLLTWYPGDRNYRGIGLHRNALPGLQSSFQADREISGTIYTGDIGAYSEPSPNQPKASAGPKIKRRYVWKE